MGKIYTALGLMSGTSMDGVDASIIQTDGKSKYKAILDKYFKYPENIYNDLTILRDKIKTSKDLKKLQKKIKSVEKDITIFHAESVEKILKKTRLNVDFIGFHGQTIFHNAKEKISKQIGDGKLLSERTRKTVIYDFRQNDLKNGGEGAPVSSAFHRLLVKQNKIIKPVCILNIGGIANITTINSYENDDLLTSKDIGPGNCLIDEWIRKNNKGNYDTNGRLAKKGKVDEVINIGLEEGDKLENSIEGMFVRTNFSYTPKRTKDIKDYSRFVSRVKNLSVEDGAATLTEITAKLIAIPLERLLYEHPGLDFKILVCGGGRKNKLLMERIKELSKQNIQPIDDYGIDGDFVESQAFAYLAIRSYLGLPITFPNTTGCKEPTTGGVIVENFKKE